MLKGQDRSRFGQGRSDLDWSWLNLDRLWPNFERTWPNLEQSCPNVEGSRSVKIRSRLVKSWPNLTDQSLVNKVCNQKFVRFDLQTFNFRIFESYVNRVERFGRISEFPKFHRSLPLRSLQIRDSPTSMWRRVKNVISWLWIWQCTCWN